MFIAWIADIFLYVRAVQTGNNDNDTIETLYSVVGYRKVKRVAVEKGGGITEKTITYREESVSGDGVSLYVNELLNQGFVITQEFNEYGG